MTHPYSTDLDKNSANHVALSPVSFLERSAGVYPEHLAVVHGARRFSWRETYARCRQLASALVKAGVRRNDTVAVILSNTPEMYEVHFGVPMIGAVLNAINTRLDAETVAFILNHGEAKVLITDREFSPVVRAALASVEQPLLVIDVCDSEYLGEGERIGEHEYEEFIAAGDPAFTWQLPEDEWDAIALNYGSSHFPGEGGLDFQEEVIDVPEAIGHAFDHLDPVVYPLQQAGVHVESRTGEDAPSITLEVAGKAL